MEGLLSYGRAPIAQSGILALFDIFQNCHGNRLYVDDSIQSLGSAMLKPRRHMPRTRLQNSIPT